MRNRNQPKKDIKKIHPHPGKQVEFLQNLSDWLLFGGMRGGGKSFMLTWKAAFLPRRWHYENAKGKQISEKEFYNQKADGRRSPRAIVDKVSIDFSEYKAKLIRRTHKQLEKNLMPEAKKLYPHYGGRWIEREKAWRFPSGATVYMDHCKDRKALSNHIGGNYQFIGIDEANQFPWKWVNQIEGSLRSNIPDFKTQFCLTSNPGNIGHLWLKRKFVERSKAQPKGDPIYKKQFDVYYQPQLSGPEYKDKNRITWKYIPCSVFENPSIVENDPKYVLRLKNKPETIKKMWLHGDWDVFAGMYFDEWNPIHHIISAKNFRYGQHFSRSTHDLYRAYDYGTHAPFICLFIAVDRDGNAIVFDEIKEEGLAASKQAKKVNQYTEDEYGLHPEDFEDEIADPAYFTKHSQNKHGELYSPADFYADQGINLYPGNNDRSAGAKVIYQALTIPEQGPPRIRFTDNCEYCIETIPNLPHDKKDQEKVATDGEDHAYDAVRYFGMEYFTTSILPEKPEKKGWRQRITKEYKNKANNVNWMAA